MRFTLIMSIVWLVLAVGAFLGKNEIAGFSFIIASAVWNAAYVIINELS